ncbi:MAG: thioredoxin domain-containing protein, partial [Anaerolineae bacterium]|nr:thioredoxin domain-containing protein [Anaerolineae bacterium]
RLWHTWYNGAAKVAGFLEDYTHLAYGLLALYQATFDPDYYSVAGELVAVVLEHFRAGAGFYDTADDGPALVVRPREVQDNAVPSGNAVAVTVLLELARLGAGPRDADLARRNLRDVQSFLSDYPLGFGQWLIALTAATTATTEVAVVGNPGAEEVRALLEVAQAGYNPHRLVAAGARELPALLAGREQQAGHATAYVCRQHTCYPPVTSPEDLAVLLR